MQIIEVTPFGVRAAVFHLRREGSALEFRVFSMIHVGSASYYREVGRRLKECTLLFTEGVGGRRASYITLSYRLVAKIKRFDLVTQNVLSLSSLGPQIINTDVSAKEFGVSWRAIPRGFRALLYLAVPAFVLWMLCFGTQSFWTRYTEQNDLPSREEDLMNTEAPTLFDALVTQRDTVLRGHIERLHRERADDAIVAGIVYGAAHVPGVMHILSALGYRTAKAEWVTVAPGRL